jgi:hypothetical protein
MVKRATIAAGATWLLAMTLPVSAIETPEAAPEPIIEYLQKAGVNICIDSVSNFVEVLNRTASGYGAQITLPISPANEHMISISIEIELPDSTQYVSLTAAPVPSGGCEMNVETLSHGPCPESPGETASFLQRTIRLEENGRARRTYFMPLADGSCNIITKEVIY